MKAQTSLVEEGGVVVSAVDRLRLEAQARLSRWMALFPTHHPALRLFAN